MDIPLRMLSRHATAQALPYADLATAIEQLLHDPTVDVPARLIQKLPGGGSLFVMPASNAHIAMTKLITFVADNAQRALPTIQGDILVFDAHTGQRQAILDGPTVTARRTAAVSLLAAQKLAMHPKGALLIVGAGVQGQAHLEAFREGLGTNQVAVASRSVASADQLVEYARSLGMHAERIDNADAALADFPLVVSTTSAQQVALRALPHAEAFIAAVGAFTPAMVEWAPDVCRHIHAHGTVVVDSRDADHEAGDLLQAGLDVSAMPTLGDVLRQSLLWTQRKQQRGPVLFKSCGWGGWDLAAAQCVAQQTMRV